MLIWLLGLNGHATEEIGTRIQAMQADTRNASGIIEKTTEIIGKMSTISQTIAASVEQQSAAIEIATTIVGVNQAASGTASAAAQSNASARELAEMSMRLRGIVSSFKV